jgi:hypothetical protein
MTAMADSVDPIEKYPKLASFLIGSFHEDWYEDQKQRNEPPEPDLVVGHSIKENPREFLMQVSKELAMVFDRYDDNGLTNLVRREFYAGVRPELRGLTMRQWLESVKQRIDEHLRFSL